MPTPFFDPWADGPTIDEDYDTVHDDLGWFRSLPQDIRNNIRSCLPLPNCACPRCEDVRIAIQDVSRQLDRSVEDLVVNDLNYNYSILRGSTADQWGLGSRLSY